MDIISIVDSIESISLSQLRRSQDVGKAFEMRSQPTLRTSQLNQQEKCETAKDGGLAWSEGMAEAHAA